MTLSNVTGYYYQSNSTLCPKTISYQQLLALHVADHYKLLRSSMGWWAEGYNRLDVVRIHSPTTIKSLLKHGLLEGNSGGERLGMGDRNEPSTKEKPTLWISAKGKTFLDKITVETGLVFDTDSYQLTEAGSEQEADCLFVGDFETEREAALAYDHAAILLYGDEAETNFPPEESEHIVLSDEVARQ